MLHHVLEGCNCRHSSTSPARETNKLIIIYYLGMLTHLVLYCTYLLHVHACCVLVCCIHLAVVFFAFDLITGHTTSLQETGQHGQGPDEPVGPKVPLVLQMREYIIAAISFLTKSVGPTSLGFLPLVQVFGDLPALPSLFLILRFGCAHLSAYLRSESNTRSPRLNVMLCMSTCSTHFSLRCICKPKALKSSAC